MWQASKKVTTLGATELMEKRHALRCRIDSWCEIQRIYMPCIDQVRAAHSANTSGSSNISSTPATASNVTPSPAQNPETTCLFLPSSIPSSFWTTGCIEGLVDKEQRLRLAQADDSLSELRRLLRISATLVDYKKNQIGGGSQKMNTRARALLSRFHDKKIRCAERYSNAYKALNILDPHGAWTSWLKFLDHKKDLRPPRRSEDDESRETRRELSWIWLVRPEGGPPKAVASADEINDSMTSHCACRPILTFVLLQPCVWSGPGQKRVHIDGARKYYL